MVIRTKQRRTHTSRKHQSKHTADSSPKSSANAQQTSFRHCLERVMWAATIQTAAIDARVDTFGVRCFRTLDSSSFKLYLVTLFGYTLLFGQFTIRSFRRCTDFNVSRTLESLELSESNFRRRLEHFRLPIEMYGRRRMELLKSARNTQSSCVRIPLLHTQFRTRKWSGKEELFIFVFKQNTSKTVRNVLWRRHRPLEYLPHDPLQIAVQWLAC